MAEGQENIYYISGESTDRMAKLPQVKLLSDKGCDVLLTDEVDEFVTQSMMTYAEKPFCNAAIEDLGLQSEDDKKALEEKAEEMKGLLAFVKDTLGKKVQEVKLSGSMGDSPVRVVPGRGMSFEIENYMRRANPEISFPSVRILELNPEHPAVQVISNLE